MIGTIETKAVDFAPTEHIDVFEVSSKVALIENNLCSWFFFYETF